MTAKTVTVFMRTKNSGDILEQTLQALFSQSFQDFQLAVVDSGSTDDTLEILRAFSCQATSISAKDYFPGKVLNHAMESISSDLIIFLNSDAVMTHPQVLEKVVLAFEDPDVQGVFGRQIPRPDAEPWVIRDYQISFPPSPLSPPWMTMSLPLAGMRKSIWLKRPFYEQAWGSEDIEWGHWAKTQGVTIQYIPEAVVMHSHNYTLRQLYGRRFIEGEADAFIYNKRYSFSHMLFDFVKATFRDFAFYVFACQWIKMIKIPAIRWVYFWSYYKGHRWGAKRNREGNANSNFGQEQVLKRYEDKKN